MRICFVALKNFAPPKILCARLQPSEPSGYSAALIDLKLSLQICTPVFLLDVITTGVYEMKHTLLLEFLYG